MIKTIVRDSIQCTLPQVGKINCWRVKAASKSPKVLVVIEFQDGFKGDTVIVKINENEVFRKENISTNLMLGLAGTFKVEVEKGKNCLRINVPTKDLERMIPLNILYNVHLGISVVDGMIDFKISDEPFVYL